MRLGEADEMVRLGDVADELEALEHALKADAPKIDAYSLALDLMRALTDLTAPALKDDVWEGIEEVLDAHNLEEGEISTHISHALENLRP